MAKDIVVFAGSNLSLLDSNQQIDMLVSQLK
jgi:hypothetical protein